MSTFAPSTAAPMQSSPLVPSLNRYSGPMPTAHLPTPKAHSADRKSLDERIRQFKASHPGGRPMYVHGDPSRGTFFFSAPTAKASPPTNPSPATTSSSPFPVVSPAANFDAMVVDSSRGSRPSPQSRPPDTANDRRRSSLSHTIGTASLGPLSKRKLHAEPTDPPSRKRASLSRRLSQYQDVMCEVEFYETAQCPTPLSPTLPALPLPTNPSESKDLHPAKAKPGPLESNTRAFDENPPRQPAKAPTGLRRGRVNAAPNTSGPMVRASLLVKLVLPSKPTTRNRRDRQRGEWASPDSTAGSGPSQPWAQSKRARNPTSSQRRSTIDTPVAKDNSSGKECRSQHRMGSPALRPMAGASPVSSQSLKTRAGSFTQLDEKVGDWNDTTPSDGPARSRQTKPIRSITRRSAEARARPDDERPRSRSRRRSFTPSRSPRERSGSRQRPVRRDPTPTAARSKPRDSKGRDWPSPMVGGTHRARGNSSDDVRPTDQPSRSHATASSQSPHAESTGRRVATRPEIATPSKASSLPRSSPVRYSMESYQQKRSRPHRDDEELEVRKVVTPSKPSTLRSAATVSPHPDRSLARPALAPSRDGDNPNRYMEWGTRYKRTGQANVQKRQPTDRMVGVLQYFQSVLAYLKHFYDLDSSANLLSRVTHWKNFLTYAQSLSSIFRDNRCPALAGLILHLEAVIHHRLGALYQTLANNECSKTSDGHDSAALSSVVQLFQQQANVMRAAKRAWADGEALFSFDALADQFSHTWQLRGPPASRAVDDREFDAYRRSMVSLVGAGTIPSSFTLYTPIPDIIRLLECVLFETAYSHSLDFQVYKNI
ncbi:hypothetical protein H4R35_001248 [Dimargaris xerosporica]|nr:hypothetical protein H4R35_001248 [Dimargaris xerosporica]